jgi:hypothetical protein
MASARKPRIKSTLAMDFPLLLLSNGLTGALETIAREDQAAPRLPGYQASCGGVQ